LRKANTTQRHETSVQLRVLQCSFCCQGRRRNAATCNLEPPCGLVTARVRVCKSHTSHAGCRLS
jgi:hypothetical protein